MRSETVTVISDSYQMTSIWFKDMIAAIQKKASEAKFSTEELCFEEDPIEWSKLPEVVIVATGSLAFLQHILQKIKPYKKRVVLAGLDSQPFGAEISCATPSRQSETNLIVSYFNYYNRKKIALVGFRTDGINDMLRYQTAISAIAQYEEQAMEALSFFWHDSLTECLDIFIASADKFNGAICPNDATAICLINACNAHGIRVPEDLYIASFTNMQVGRYSKPSLTTVGMDFHSIGEQTFNVWNFLNEHIDSDIAVRIHVPSTLIARKSTDYMPEPPFDSPASFIDLYDFNFFSDTFFESSHIQSIMEIENCISHRDPLDFKIMSGLLSDLSYEALSESLFISMSGIRYRVNKIYKDAGVSTRVEFVELIRKHLGGKNPFASVAC
jgi:DNA-binding LacI/PurR family transcriptional regulator